MNEECGPDPSPVFTHSPQQKHSPWGVIRVRMGHFLERWDLKHSQGTFACHHRLVLIDIWCTEMLSY